MKRPKISCRAETRPYGRVSAPTRNCRKFLTQLGALSPGPARSPTAPSSSACFCRPAARSPNAHTPHAHGRGQGPVPPQLVVIIHIFVAQRETQNPLPQQRHQRMHHLGRVPVIRETCRGALEQQDLLGQHQQQRRAPVATQLASTAVHLHPAPSAALRPPFGQRGRISRTPLPEPQPEHEQHDHQRAQHAPPPLPEPDQSILRGQDGCRRPAGPQSIPTLRREPAQMTAQAGRQLMPAQCRKPCHRLLKVRNPTAGQSRATQGGRLQVLDSKIHHVGTRDHLTKRRLP